MEQRSVPYDSQREVAEILSMASWKNWKCTRHAQPDKLLTLDHPAVSAVLVNTKVMTTDMRGEPKFLQMSWRAEGDTSGSGYSHSAAHNAYAEDFPEGTRLVITAYVETPEQAAVAASTDTGSEG